MAQSSKANKNSFLGKLNQIPAGIIDRLYRDKPKEFLGKAMNFIKIRLVYCFLFIPLAFIDTLVSAFVAMSYSFRSFFTSDKKQEDLLERQKIHATNFSKNFFALLASLIGFISPTLVILYFVPAKTESEGVSAGGDYYHAPNAVMESPESIEELQELVKRAAREGKKIMPRGTGFSQGKQFLPEGEDNLIVVDLSKFNRVEIQSKEKQVIAGAGAIWSQIKVEANKFKLALKVMQASDVFSVGGSLGTNIHGWNIADGMLSTVVSSITIVNAQGRLVVLTPDNPHFHHVTGGMGLFGIVVEATIKLTDNELLKEKGIAIEPSQYANHFRKEVQNDPNTRMHLYRLSLTPGSLLTSGVAVSYVKEDEKKPVQDELRLETEHGTRFDRVMINLARHSPWVRKKYWEMERDRLLTNKGTEISVNEIMQPPINAMFNPAVSESEWLQEFFLPEENLADFLKELGNLLDANKVRLLNASVRFVKQNNKSPLSYAHDGDRFAVVLCFNQPLNETALIQAKKWIRDAQKLSVEKDGSYYLPYQQVSKPDDFQRSYPYVAEAVAAKKEMDPDNLFVSGLYQKYMAPNPTQQNHFKIIMATAESKAQFAGFLHNILHRIDSDKFFSLLEDVMRYNDSHAEIYQELAQRLPEITPNGLSDFKRILNSLSAIKTDLAAQARTLLPKEMKTINGLVEIGYPGRFINGFKEHYKITGEIVAVYEQQSITDYIQTGFPHPYTRFEHLDYNKPNLSNLADNSADVITCYVGLHHFAENELESFLEDVRRVLRPEGRFLLVDHDVVDEQTLSMAHMAHTVFNVVNGVSLKEEMTETRRFNSMDYWKQKLEKHGLGYAVDGPDVPLIRNGDPSCNRMVSFAKPDPLKQLAKETANKRTDNETVRPNVLAPPPKKDEIQSNGIGLQKMGFFPDATSNITITSPSTKENVDNDGPLSL